jgi:D-glycero-alpha-D-manno-heptose-7-phosphate kinase
MLIRSRAPLRLGLAGGGTDVSPYSDIYGGAILNVCINMFARATIVSGDAKSVTFTALDLGISETYTIGNEILVEGPLTLLKGIYINLVERYPKIANQSIVLETYVDAPKGSGLGSSSTLVVAVIKAFAEFFELPLGEYDLAHLAYEIERKDLKMAGGKQDQYAAAFGGVNFMEFLPNNNVIVNPLKVKDEYLFELENNLLLYYTGTSRLSFEIIEQQAKNVVDMNSNSLDAMHEVKKQAVLMKEALLKGNLMDMGAILDYGWEHKKKMASNISNPSIDLIYETAKEAGATGGKLSGAGGGGFFVFFCPANTSHAVRKKLSDFGGQFYNFQFYNEGAKSWRVKT